jgi:hypothetical protein
MQLYEDINLLQRIVPLQLTDAQLDGALKLYEQHPPAGPADEDAETIRKLEEIKQRLLSGTPLVATDFNTLRELYRGAMRGRTPRPDGTPAPGAPGAAPLSDLEQGLWDLLDMTQKAALLGDVRQAAANNQKADQVMGQRVITMIGETLKLDEAAWLKARDRLAAALAGNVGAPDSPARRNCRQLFVDFLDRIRRMPPAEFAAKQQELSAELLALVPPGTRLIVAVAAYDRMLFHSAMAGTFLHPRAPELLAEMKAARAK